MDHGSSSAGQLRVPVCLRTNCASQSSEKLEWWHHPGHELWCEGHAHALQGCALPRVASTQGSLSDLCALGIHCNGCYRFHRLAMLYSSAGMCWDLSGMLLLLRLPLREGMLEKTLVLLLQFFLLENLLLLEHMPPVRFVHLFHLRCVCAWNLFIARACILLDCVWSYIFIYAGLILFRGVFHTEALGVLDYG